MLSLAQQLTGFLESFHPLQLQPQHQHQPRSQLQPQAGLFPPADHQQLYPVFALALQLSVLLISPTAL